MDLFFLILITSLITSILICKYHGLITVFTWYDKTYGIHQVNKIDFAVFAKYYLPFNTWNGKKWLIELFNANIENNQQRFFSTTGNNFPNNSKFVINRFRKTDNSNEFDVIVTIYAYNKEFNEFVIHGYLETAMCKRLSRKWLGWKKKITFYSNISNLPEII